MRRVLDARPAGAGPGVSLQEPSRDEPENGGGGLVCTSDTTASAGDLVFIQDRLGYHKVGNPDPTQPAFTLHLYSPPIDRCRIWLDAAKSDCSSSSECCNYSEYGEKL